MLKHLHNLNHSDNNLKCDGEDDCNKTNLVGLWVGIGLVATLIICLIVLFALRYYFRGPLKGSNNPGRLDDQTVAITGNSLEHSTNRDDQTFPVQFRGR